VWHVAAEGRGTPAVLGSSAFFLSKHHELFAVDVATGRVLWRRPTGGPGTATAGSSVASTRGLVVAGDGDLVAFDAAGAEHWRFRASDGAAPGTYLGAAAGDVVLAGSAAGRLFAIDARRGVPKWTLSVGDARYTTVFAPVADDTSVAAGFTTYAAVPAGGVVHADLASGRVRWRASVCASPRTGEGLGFGGGPIFVDDVVIVACRSGALFALDRRSGAVRWSLAAEPAMGQDYRALARVGRVLVAGSLTGRITAYDLDTRRRRWQRTPVDASVASGIASDDDAVYVPFLSGDLVALAVDHGGERWRSADGGWGLSWQPLLAGGRLFASGSGAGFFAFAP
jgi:outer membrane protein assembly factor BamB